MRLKQIFHELPLPLEQIDSEPLFVVRSAAPDWNSGSSINERHLKKGVPDSYGSADH